MADPKIPKSISPCPIKSAIIEIRFESSMSFQEMQRIVFGQLKDKIDDVVPAFIPFELTGPEIDNVSKILYLSGPYSIGFGNKSILFETKEDYPLWDNFFDFIRTCIISLSEKFLVDEIKRISTRYINIFEPTMDFRDVFDVNVDLSIDSFKRKSIKITSEFQSDDRIIILNLSDGSTLKTGEKTVTGYLLDIDVIQLRNLPQSFNELLLEPIDSIHSLEKKVFFDFLSDKYMQTLNTGEPL